MPVRSLERAVASRRETLLRGVQTALGDARILEADGQAEAGTAADRRLAAPSVAPVQDVIAGRYALGEELGRGGMAHVRAARDLRLHRTVAVKLLDARATPDPAARRRFVREARAAASFSHPNAVAVFDAGDADGFLYLVMELIEGRSLAERLATGGALPVDDAVGIVDDVLLALGAAHRAGIVHRDVKPGNVLVTNDGTAKLADFGIAKRTGDGDLTLAGQFIGTPEYLSPEQVSGGPVTPSTDLYAAGVVLFEALAGAPPFAAGSPLATALAHRDISPPDVRSQRRDVPDHIARAVARAMEKDPARRFSSADDMRAALTGRAVTAPPPAVMPRRTTRTWWWLAVALAVVIAGVAIALGAGGDPPSASPSTTGAPLTTAAPATTTTVAATTTSTTVAATAPATPPLGLPSTATIDELLVFVEFAPGLFGERADDLRRGLERIVESGRQRDVERLREDVAEWREDGSLPEGAATVIDAILASLALPDDDDDDDDD